MSKADLPLPWDRRFPHGLFLEFDRHVDLTKPRSCEGAADVSWPAVYP